LPAERPLVALTGAGGFIGRALAARLEAAGFRVVALSTGLGTPPKGVEVRPLPASDAPAEAFRDALGGAVHLVHAGARNNASRRDGDEAYRQANAALTARLARAAADVVPGRTILLSSIRAAAGPLWSGEITDGMAPRPADPYGRSKRLGEEAALEAFTGRKDGLAVLRLAPVYGPGAGGNLRALLRLADTPWPLPLRGLPGRRSLLGLEAAAGAVVHLLALSRLPELAVMAASDAEPVTLAALVAAMREGLGRPRRLVSAPRGWLARFAGAAGKADAWSALTVTQVCRPERLRSTGWQPPSDSLAGLREAARSGRAR
jgi:UDP-glucose 4-epimerase